ncbi:polymer-forming cytoskeletal protein [Alphaproteobacteria bacterium]|nr:polymer-forming cytoskeletal protein [Alphaproteobacteria bacterium]MDC3193046.1 polymer-forming cytoskeletal protein [Alphaproteobacteria bacterium]
MLAKSHEQITNLHEDTTYILGDLIMEGSLDGGNHPVVIDGQFNGDITAPDVIILEQGKVTGAINTQTVVINGYFKGNLVCESLTVTSSGIVEGEVQTNALSIDLGAEVIGSISRVNVKSN